jgi:hypothetical protein
MEKVLVAMWLEKALKKYTDHLVCKRSGEALVTKWLLKDMLKTF